MSSADDTELLDELVATVLSQPKRSGASGVVVGIAVFVALWLFLLTAIAVLAVLWKTDALGPVLRFLFPVHISLGS
jgi:hypothetical protein